MALSCRFQATRSNKLNGPRKVELLLEMHQVPRVERWGCWGIGEELMDSWGNYSDQQAGWLPQRYSRWEILYIEFLRSCHMLILCWNALLRLHVMWHVTHMVNQVIHGEGIFFSYQERGLPSDPSIACDWGNFPWAGWLIGYNKAFQETHSSWARSCRSKKRRGLSTWMILVSYMFYCLYKPRSLCRSLHGSAPLASQFKVKLVNMSFAIYLHSENS